MNQYMKELSGLVALPDRMNCTLNLFARRIAVYIRREQEKTNPDNGLISVLCDAARLGYEYGQSAGGDATPRVDDTER